MNQLINFARTNNAVPIVFSLIVFLTAGTFAASPEVREDIRESLVSSQFAVQSVDNTRLLAADIASFEFRPQIIAVTEDSDDYYIEYSYSTFLLEDSVWQVKDKLSKLTVNKAALGVRDLGEYVAEELKEVIDYERSYLAETRNIEKINGATQKVVTTTYSGLIGKFFDEKQDVFAGYERVVKTPDIAPASTTLAGGSNNQEQGLLDIEAVSETLTADYIRYIVKEMIDKSNMGQVQKPAAGSGAGDNVSGTMFGSKGTTIADSENRDDGVLDDQEISPADSVANENSTTTMPMPTNDPISPAVPVPAASRSEITTNISIGEEDLILLPESAPSQVSPAPTAMEIVP